MGVRHAHSLIGCAVLALFCAGCGTHVPDDAAQLVGGDQWLGERLVHEYSCLTCHELEGYDRPGRTARVKAPPLTDLLERVYIVDTVPNNPENLVAFIRDPQHVAPQAQMPWVGATMSDARDIATFLYSTSR